MGGAIVHTCTLNNLSISCAHQLPLPSPRPQRYIGFLRRSVTAAGQRCAVYSNAGGGGSRAAELAPADQLCLPQAFDFLST